MKKPTKRNVKTPVLSMSTVRETALGQVSGGEQDGSFQASAGVG